jgi:hypothetical protein
MDDLLLESYYAILGVTKESSLLEVTAGVENKFKSTTSRL